jgi:hypothetical protein
LIFAKAKVKANSKANTVIEIVIVNEVVFEFKIEIYKNGNSVFWKTRYNFTARTVAVKFQKNVRNFALPDLKIIDQDDEPLLESFYQRSNSNIASIHKAFAIWFLMAKLICQS